MADDYKGNDIESLYHSLLRSAGITFLGGILIALALAAVLSRGTGGITRAAPPDLILYPAFAMFLIAALVLTRLGGLRIGEVRPPDVRLRFNWTFSEDVELQQ